MLLIVLTIRKNHVQLHAGTNGAPIFCRTCVLFCAVLFQMRRASGAGGLVPDEITGEGYAPYVRS